MELLKYLNEHFFTKNELLNVSKVTEQELSGYQTQGVMPRYSYKLNLSLQSDSFFGVHNEVDEVEYYAKGYSSWLALVQSLTSENAIYAIFAERYQTAIDNLKKEGHSSSDPKVNEGIELHIQEEWQHFLNGTYGLCTKSGLPEDISAKELAILEINELTAADKLTEKQLNKLTAAVNLLDSASALFAPHERPKSSRHRMINAVRRIYQLQS